MIQLAAEKKLKVDTVEIDLKTIGKICDMEMTDSKRKDGENIRETAFIKTMFP